MVSASTTKESGVHDLLVSLLDIPGPRDAECEDENGFRYVAVTPPKGADYQFRLHLWDDEEPQISAVLQSNPDAYFWYEPFEETAFDSLEDAYRSFYDAVVTILFSPSRITQQCGLLFCDFTLEYRDQEKWNSWGSVLYFRFGRFDAPRIDGKKRVYSSPAPFPDQDRPNHRDA